MTEQYKNDEKEQLDQIVKDGNTALYELLEAFPDFEDDLLDLYSAYVFKELSSKEYKVQVRRMCSEFVRQCVMTVKQGILLDREKRLLNAYYDVARYQTDPVDAGIEWNVEKDILGFLLKRRPPPDTPEERRQLPVPTVVVKKREII